MTDDYTSALVEQRIAELSDEEFQALVERTRPPKLDPKEAATAALRRRVRGHDIGETTTKSAADAKAALDKYFGRTEAN